MAPEARKGTVDGDTWKIALPFHPFWGEGSPTETDYRKSWYPYSHLSTGGPWGITKIHRCPFLVVWVKQKYMALVNPGGLIICQGHLFPLKGHLCKDAVLLCRKPEEPKGKQRWSNRMEKDSTPKKHRSLFFCGRPGLYTAGAFALPAGCLCHGRGCCHAGRDHPRAHLAGGDDAASPRNESQGWAFSGTIMGAGGEGGGREPKALKPTRGLLLGNMFFKRCG